jgi:uncharacterized protein (DUF433 family)
LIASDPRVHGGEPVIRGTRVPVRSIVIAYERYNGDRTREGEAFPVDPKAIQAALAYYKIHRDEIDRIIEKREQDAVR